MTSAANQQLGVFQTVSFFENLQMDRIFLFLALRKEIYNFIHILIKYGLKTKIANSPENYVHIFFWLYQ